MPTLRPLLLRDFDRVLAINHDSQPHVARLDSGELARLQTLSAAHCVLEEEAHGIVGYALVFAHHDDYDGEEFLHLRHRLSRPFLYIDQVALAEPARRRGHGRALYAELARQALQRGLHSLCCEVNTQPANPASLAFHQRLGFVRLGSLCTADGREVALLQRTLTPEHSPTPASAGGVPDPSR